MVKLLGRVAAKALPDAVDTDGRLRSVVVQRRLLVTGVAKETVSSQSPMYEEGIKF
jgi:hypothetical protein